MNRKRSSKYAALIIIILSFLIPLLPMGRYFHHVCIIILTYIIATSSLRAIYISGQVSVGHAAFMGIGAYASAILSLRLGWTPWITMPIGAMLSALVAVLSGYLFSRLRSLYFSMVTFFFGITIEAVMRTWSNLTGGRSGLVGFPKIPSINILGLGEINFAASKVPYYYLLLILVLLTILVLYRLEKSRTGMNWMAIEQSPLVSASVGISETKYRVLAFSVGCFFSGLAGGVYAHYNGVLSTSTFALLPSIYMVIYMLLGGVGSFVGPIIGVIVLIMIPEIFRPLKEYTPFVFGGVMLLVIFLLPKGLVGLFQREK